ncbi:MAG: hypothetical protein ACJATT_005685 [Myxococcota bacterium]
MPRQRAFSPVCIPPSLRPSMVDGCELTFIVIYAVLEPQIRDVLLLNSDFAPVGIVPWERAVGLLLDRRVRLVETYPGLRFARRACRWIGRRLSTLSATRGSVVGRHSIDATCSRGTSTAVSTVVRSRVCRCLLSTMSCLVHRQKTGPFALQMVALCPFTAGRMSWLRAGPATSVRRLEHRLKPA